MGRPQGFWNDFSNESWKRTLVAYSQVTQVLKFTYAQYIRDAKKHTFVPQNLQIVNCTLCQAQTPDTCTPSTFSVPRTNKHRWRTKRHDNVEWELHKPFVSNKTSKCYTIVNVAKTNDKPQDNTIATWLLACTCNTRPCRCNLRLRSNMLLIMNHPHDVMPPTQPNENILIQFIEFTYGTFDKFPHE